MAISELRAAADNDNATAAAALAKLKTQGLAEPTVREAANALREQLARMIAEQVAATNRDVENVIPRNDTDPAAEDGRQIARAIVNGEAGAEERLLELSRSEHRDFRTNMVGLSQNAVGDLALKTFAPLRRAFDILGTAAANNDTNALAAIVDTIQLPDLKNFALQSIGTLARHGNVSAGEILVDPAKFGFFPSAGIGYGRGVADGMQAPAKAGNERAIELLITLSTNRDPEATNSAITGLRIAADNQNAKAIEALKKLGEQ